MKIAVVVAAALACGAGQAFAQVQVDAGAITLTATRQVSLSPTEAFFGVNIMAPAETPIDQVLAAVQPLGLTQQDLTNISNYPVGPYPGSPWPDTSRITYQFALRVPVGKMKDTFAQLERMRKTVDSNLDLQYYGGSVGASAAAVEEARQKALPELISEARRRAEELAAAAQLKVGRIEGLTDNMYIPYMAPAAPVPLAYTFTLLVRFAVQ